MINEIQSLVSEREWRVQWVINNKNKLESKQKAADSCKTVNTKQKKNWADVGQQDKKKVKQTKHTFPNSKQRNSQK